MRSILAAVLLSLSACADEAPGPVAAARDRAPDTAMVRSVTLEGTSSLVREQSSASTSVAVQTIDRWIARLDTVALAGAPALREDLGLLRDQLLSYPQDGPAIGTTMRRLGRQTAALPDSTAALASLARALETAGRGLGGVPADSADAAGA